MNLLAAKKLLECFLDFCLPKSSCFVCLCGFPARLSVDVIPVTRKRPFHCPPLKKVDTAVLGRNTVSFSFLRHSW